MTHVLVTEASGFIGRAVCAGLHARGMNVRAAVHTPPDSFPIAGADEIISVDDIDEDTDWKNALSGIDKIVHVAIPTPIADEDAAESRTSFLRANVVDTGRLVEQAANAGIQRFIHISSIQGDSAAGDNTDDGLSKTGFEQIYADAGRMKAMEYVILRLPLVYGPGVTADMLSLLRLCYGKFPLPFASFSHPRDMIGVDNLADIIDSCLSTPSIAGKIYAVRDGQPLSVAELITMIRKAMGRRPFMFPLSPGFLTAVAALAGKHMQVAAIFEPLNIDDKPLRMDLGWVPRFTVEDEIKKMVVWYLSSCSH